MLTKTLVLGTGDFTFSFNTTDSTGAPITLAGTPAVKVRVNGGTAVTTGLALDVDRTSAGDGHTGEHLVTFSVDNVTLALADGDHCEIIITTGTVDSISVVGRKIADFSIVADDFSAGQKTTLGDATTVVPAAVTLADAVTHGGSAALLSLRRVTVAETTNGQPAVNITSSGTGNAHGVYVNVSGGGKGVAIGAVSDGVTVDSSGADPVVFGGTPHVTAADILTTALTEAYAADGAAPTLSQALFAIQQFLQERSISGVTLTVSKLDGSTPAMTFTLDDGSAPTSLTRAT